MINSAWEYSNERNEPTNKRNARFSRRNDGKRSRSYIFCTFSFCLTKHPQYQLTSHCRILRIILAPRGMPTTFHRVHPVDKTQTLKRPSRSKMEASNSFSNFENQLYESETIHQRNRKMKGLRTARIWRLLLVLAAQASLDFHMA
jgi:hypothetical protein